MTSNPRPFYTEPRRAAHSVPIDLSDAAPVLGYPRGDRDPGSSPSATSFPALIRSAMPILKWFPPQGSPRTYVLYKPVSTIGRALGNDVAIATPGIGETHAQVLFD